MGYLSRFLTLSAVLISLVSAQGGGMAELKAITGDAPYSGVGNAPAPIPQPMGFWGRPRYAPMGFGGGGYWGGYDGPYGSDRFTSVGHSPYGEVGPIAYRPYSSDMFSAMMSFLDGASSPFSSQPSRPSPRRISPSPVPSPTHSSPEMSLSSLGGGGGGLGGFYKGSGN